jgi:hypothetical protein
MPSSRRRQRHLRSKPLRESEKRADPVEESRPVPVRTGPSAVLHRSQTALVRPEKTGPADQIEKEGSAAADADADADADETYVGDRDPQDRNV